MGPTYLVLLIAGSAALVLYRGDDQAEATLAYDVGRKDNSGKEGSANASVVLATIRSEGKLS